jgi:hypothetical protein
MSEEIQKYIKILNINCPRCLDTKILWKGRDNVFWARMDGRGDYDVINCDRCSGGGWNRCSHTTDIYARGIHAFHVADGEWHVLETLRPIVKPYLDNIVHMEALKQAERIRKEKEEADRIQKEKEEKEEADRIQKEKEEKEEAERIQEEDSEYIKDDVDSSYSDHSDETEDAERMREKQEKEDDENPMPLWAYYTNDDFDKKIKSTDIAVEIGKIAERMYEAIKLSSGDITELTSLIKELKMDLKSSMESSTSNKTELKQITNSEGRFKVTYVKLYISNQMENTSCSCLEWCGWNTKESHFSLQYTVYKPRNIAAKKRCDEDMSKLVII